MNGKVLSQLLLLCMCTGCVHTHCDLAILHINTCGTDVERRMIKVHGQTTLRRSFIYDEWDVKDGTWLYELIKRMPVVLLTLPLQLMIYEDEVDIPMDALIDIDSDDWKNVRTYWLNWDYHRERRENANERKVCDVAMPDGRNATFIVKYREGVGSVGDLHLRIVEKNGTVSEKMIYEFISHWWGWLVVDDGGTVAYVKLQNYRHTCDLPLLPSEQRDSASIVAYRLNWQSVKFEPVVELGYGELVMCADVQ